MLVLRRKVGERIVLAGTITISILGVEGKRVKVGITAPPDVPIVREELLRPSDEQTKQAIASSLNEHKQR